MPYIPQIIRKGLASWTLKELGDAPPTPAELNYIINFLIYSQLAKIENYAQYNNYIGALECAKLELYRRKAALYEDKKILENGDIEI